MLEEVATAGASTARDLDDGAPRDKDDWGWNWSETRKALDYLFLVGDLAIAGRNSQFERVYDLPERVLPAAVLATPVPEPAEAPTELVRRAARCPRGRHRAAACATTTGCRSAARLEGRRCRDELVEDGELLPVTIEGWKRPAYLHRDATLPRRVDARALLSPFDPVVWERERTEQLFDFHYRIEIYVPEPKRQYGYYVLPFLLGDRIVGRVDLKADRKAGRLLVKAAYAERSAPPETAEELAAELRDLASWLGLDDIVVCPRGDLAEPVRVELRQA